MMDEVDDAAVRSQFQAPKQHALKQMAGNAGRAIGNFTSTTFQNLTTRKYTLPDKSVASQVLMYRQLLHTKCRPALKLSREYQGTPAQRAVIHMPWWEEGIEDTRKMTISYDNLIVRLWLGGAIMPFVASKAQASIETLIDEKGLPPIPHEYWVRRLGFQQPDPVTDFRSGGVLSLAMMVHVVETCPKVHSRFVEHGDAAVLPFGITCINVTDMLAKFLMLAKSVDRMDALLSQKPFWRMFADPNSILALQELSLDMLADVVVELAEERKIPFYETKNGLHGDESNKVTVFDFSEILERTEKRVRDDLLGGGPKSVQELRSIHARIKVKYEKQLERKKAIGQQLLEESRKEANRETTEGESSPMDVANQVVANATNVAVGATAMAVGVLSQIKPPTFNPLRKTDDNNEPENKTEVVQQPPDLLSGTAATEDADADWVQTPPVEAATAGIEQFSIDDEDDDL